MPKMYIISGCNGAGKTTASFTILPEMLECREFINADEVARGLSPFAPEKAALDAGRIMLTKINSLIEKRQDFAFETTLSPKSHAKTIEKAKQLGYDIILLFLWLDSVELAIDRVKKRVKEGGHDIPNEVITRRYYVGIKNLLNLYIPICDYWIILDNSNPPFEIIAEGDIKGSLSIENNCKFEKIKKTNRNE